MTLLSFVIPCYRSEKTIAAVIDEIISTVSQREEYDYEIIAVDDFSPDRVSDVLAGIAENNQKVKVIRLAKNMGKHAAVLAGYSFVKGDYIVNLDDDGQSPTYELWKLIDAVETDECDYATAAYNIKKESKMKVIGSNFNMWMGHVLLNKPRDFRFENFSVIKSFVAKEMIRYTNAFPYLPGLILRVTNRIKAIPMEERERKDGNSSGYTLKKSVALVANGMTAFSVKPLRIATVAGCLFAFLGFCYGVYIIIRKLVNPTLLVGYSSMAAILLFSCGLIMMMLGVIGEYIGRIYICINDSPQYVIKETINVDAEGGK